MGKNRGRKSEIANPIAVDSSYVLRPSCCHPSPDLRRLRRQYADVRHRIATPHGRDSTDVQHDPGGGSAGLRHDGAEIIRHDSDHLPRLDVSAALDERIEDAGAI